MATKDINFDIKVNGKQLDLAKISFKDFDKVVKEAKKDLQALPLNDPRYKVLNAEIKAADKAWKEAKKSVGDFDKELKDGENDVKSYRTQIAELIKAQVALEAQGEKNSEQYADNEKKIKALRDAQEELVRSTQDLDDTLAQIPGPIGMVGRGLQSFESLSQNASSAFKSLGLGFKGFDQILKTSLVGFLVGLLVTLVAAVMKAAKSFQPLQAAFAAVQDAVGSFFDALKPITDFILNVVVGAMNLLAGAISAVASAFGGTDKGLNKMSVNLEKQLKFQEAILNNFNSALSQNLAERLKIENDYAKRQKEIVDGEYSNELERQRDLLIAKQEYNNKINELNLKSNIDRSKRLNELDTIQTESYTNIVDNERESNRALMELKNAQSIVDLNMLRDTNQKKLENVKSNLKEIENSNIANKDELKQILIDSQTELTELDIYYRDLQDYTYTRNLEEKKKIERQYAREDIAAVNERNNIILELSTQLIKEDNARNLKAAKDSLVILQEQHRKEREEVALAGGTTKQLKEKQAAEVKVAQENERKAQLQLDVYYQQLKINDEQRNLREELSNSKDFYKRKRDVVIQELQRDLKLADGNFDKEEEARTQHWEKILAIDKEELGNIISNLEMEYDGMYQVSAEAYDKLREIENARYEEQKRGNEQNYEFMEALAKQHAKNMNMIDVEELETISSLLERRAETEKKLYGKMFQDLEDAENLSYAARLKAAGDNAFLIEVIEKEHTQKLKDLQNQKIQAYAGVATAMLDSFANVTSALAAFYEFESQNTEKSMEDRKKAFEQNKKYQIATAALSAASGIIQILTQPSTLPSPFDWIVKIANAAALGIMTAVQISKIKSTEFNASGGSGGAGQQGNILGRNYGDGGMIDGPSHKSAAGGVMINAEGGEAVMTRGAVSMFGPMLSAMNQYGGGASFIPGAAGSSRFDNPSVQNVAQDRQPLVMKTYVVSSDMKSEMEKQARLKDLSTL